MSAQRIDQLRRIETAAIAVAVAHAAVLECIDTPKLWPLFDERSRALHLQLVELRKVVNEPVDVAAPTPLALQTDARQLSIVEE